MIQNHLSRSDKDEARKSIDGQLEGLEVTMRSLRTQRNALASISAIPPEVMMDIFHHHQHASNSQTQWKKLITVTHVCSLLRHIALDCPRIWSRIDFQSPQSANQMILRSKCAPLSIELEFGTEASVDNFITHLIPSLDPALFDMSRVGRISIDAPPGRSLSRLLDHFRGRPNALRTFRVSTKSYYGRNQILALPIHTLAVPAVVHLQHLELTWCSIPWQLFYSDQDAFRALVSLKLINTLLPPREDFYRFLSRMTNLELLVLNSFPICTDTAAAMSESIQTRILLPKLSSCSLSKLTASDCRDFHTRVSYPRSSKIHLDMIFNCTTDEDEWHFNVLMDQMGLSATSQHGFRRSYPNMHIQSRQLATSVALWDPTLIPLTSIALCSSVPDSSTTPISISLAMKGTNADRIHPMLHALSVGPRLQSVSITSYSGAPQPYYTAHQWRSFLQRQNNITHLVLLSEIPCHFIAALLPYSTDICVLPKLDTLLFDNVVFSNTVIAELDCMLEERRKYGSSIKNMTMSKCRMSQQDMARLLRTAGRNDAMFVSE